jgi:hypothetical protein
MQDVVVTYSMSTEGPSKTSISDGHLMDVYHISINTLHFDGNVKRGLATEEMGLR